MENIKKDNNKFYMGENVKDAIAEIIFVPSGEDKFIIEHTFVSETLKGQGVGVLLVNKVVELARQENKKIIANCPFAKKVMTKSDEYKNVLIIS